MSRTYLQHCLKEDHLVRWPDGAMPLKIYIAPFTWYEKKKQQESMAYRQMVLDSLNLWSQISHGLFRYITVGSLPESQLDFKWRRVDRNSLGHCTYEVDAQHRLFTAEIQIGISDGLLHSAYQNASEVQHTILHEIGHALGLVGHSDHPTDIMYVPHQYGVHTLSDRDKETLNWLYRLPVGFDYRSLGPKYKLKPGFTLNDVIHQIDRNINGAGEEALIEQIAPPPASASEPSPSGILKTQSLEEQHHILSEQGRFFLRTQNIKVNPDRLLRPPGKQPPQ